MSDFPSVGGIGGGGGAGFTVGPANNLFGVTAGNVDTRPRIVDPANTRTIAESIRDDYFTANPSNLATYDLEGNEALGIILFFIDGAQTLTVGQTRVGGTWQDSISTFAVQGLNGVGAIDPSIPDGTVLIKTGGNNPVAAQSRLVQTTATGDFSIPGSMTVGVATIRLGEFAYAISAAGDNFAIKNLNSDVSFAPLGQTFGLGNTSFVRIRTGDPDNNNLPFEPTISDKTANLINPQWSQTAVSGNQTILANTVDFDSSSILTNIKLEVFLDSNLFYEAEFDTVSVGENTLTFNPAFDIRANRTPSFRVTSPDGDVVLKGNLGSGVPFQRGSLLLWTETIVLTSGDLIAGDNISLDVDSDGKVTIAGQPSGISGLIVQDDGTEEGTDINTVNFGDNLSLTVSGNVATVTGQAGGGGTTRTDEEIRDVIAAALRAGTNMSIVVDDDDDTITFNASTGTGVAIPSLHNLTINIDSRVDVNTDLNTARVINFDVTNFSLITDLVLIVTTGDNQTLTRPVSDGLQSQNVTLSGIDTSSSGSVTFQLSGTYAGGTVTSNVVTVTVADLTASEQAYYAVLATENAFTTTDVTDSAFTAVDVTQSGTVYNIQQSAPNTHVLGILSPTNRDPVEILNTVSNRQALATFNPSTNVRTINGVSYNLLTAANASGRQATFNYRVTTE